MESIAVARSALFTRPPHSERVQQPGEHRWEQSACDCMETLECQARDLKTNGLYMRVCAHCGQTVCTLFETPPEGGGASAVESHCPWPAMTDTSWSIVEVSSGARARSFNGPHHSGLHEQDTDKQNGCVGLTLVFGRAGRHELVDR